MSKATLRLVEDKTTNPQAFKKYVGELWTAKQRQLHSLHYVVSYRGSFKPELPDYCIRRFSDKGAIVFDPFSGRGTTALQANLLGRIAWGCDANPMSVRISQAKTMPVGLDEVVLKLNEVDFRRPIDLSGYSENFEPFYHPDTYRELLNLKNYIKKNPSRASRFIELIAISRLHGHSPGFFSVYSFPQISIPAESQRQINRKRRQEPDYRSVAPRIIKKTAHSLRDSFSSEFFEVSSANDIRQSDARDLSWVPTNSVDLIVTSPPFLDKVDYLTDNWLECWFAGVSRNNFGDKVIMTNSVKEWEDFIEAVLREMCRILKPKGYAIVEVGEVESRGQTIFLDEIVARVSKKVSSAAKKLRVEEVLINEQKFTKLANCFKVENNSKGTNTNRLVVMRCVENKRTSKTQAFTK